MNFATLSLVNAVSDTTSSAASLPTFFGWQLVVAVVASALAYLTVTTGASMTEAFFGHIYRPSQPFGKRQKLVNIVYVGGMFIVSLIASALVREIVPAFFLSIGLFLVWMVLMDIPFSIMLDRDRDKMFKELQAQEQKLQASDA